MIDSKHFLCSSYMIDIKFYTFSHLVPRSFPMKFLSIVDVSEPFVCAALL